MSEPKMTDERFQEITHMTAHQYCNPNSPEPFDEDDAANMLTALITAVTMLEDFCGIPVEEFLAAAKEQEDKFRAKEQGGHLQ